MVKPIVAMYSGCMKNSLVARALSVVSGFPGVEVYPTPEGAPAKPRSVMFITSDGRFPSHFLRRVQDRDKARGIERPNEAAYARAVIALNKLAQLEILKCTSAFRRALLAEHYLLHPTEAVEAEERKERSRDEWTSGVYARKRLQGEGPYLPL